MAVTKQKILRFIEDYVKQHKYAPTYREIAQGVGLTTVSTIAFHVQQLIDEGELETDHPKSPRALRVKEDNNETD